NIGGGGFMVIRLKNGAAIGIDFREKAPKAAWRSMFLDSMGNVSDKSHLGHLSVGVPGTVAGLLKALEKYGTMKTEDILQPAIDIAHQGFVVDKRLAENFVDYKDELCSFSSTVRAFTKNGVLYTEGDTLRQPELARSLERIQRLGKEGFYRGETARLIIEEMRRGGGLLTYEDLEEYEAVLREPIKGRYRGYDNISMSPPSSGGICLMQLLSIVEGYDLKRMGFHSSSSIHVMTEAMKRVYADRAEYMGDPDYVDVPVDFLISKEYASIRRNEIDSRKATPGGIVHHGKYLNREGENTTHYVVADREGNVVSTTYTINDLFGSKVVVEGGGFFLNDEMDDFSAKPGVQNIYGLIGGDANAIVADKRMLSSMTPTIVLKEGKPVMAFGARGGPKIITAVFQTLVNVIDFEMTLQEAVNAPRFHHQWIPDELLYEKNCFSEDVQNNLQSKGHILKERKFSLGELEALFIDPRTGRMYGAPDHREGGVAIGY
ncbi:MAG TPA: gamma-glutamyltransferase, partial [Bacteroidota bacterium]|nr:gamma-glutamyltransferase [Bacteroidota bacterium]